MKARDVVARRYIDTPANSTDRVYLGLLFCRQLPPASRGHLSDASFFPYTRADVEASPSAICPHTASFFLSRKYVYQVNSSPPMGGS